MDNRTAYIDVSRRPLLRPLAVRQVQHERAVRGEMRKLPAVEAALLVLTLTLEPGVAEFMRRELEAEE